ncbi:MAG TPA: YlxR family protein [Candidatus Fournierella merdavium]|uniref:RNase P modulator RnpM n=1 Tax=Candidatus Allofournierella merdavium TaxID=2838593 RepID=UPI001F945A59|nr:YlxR family protein [Candidatus Fournierella merdavium]
MQQRKIPLRRCTGCNEQKPKKELVRIVRSPQGEIALDRVGKMPGRGAYLCPSAQCLAKARKAKRLERALDAQIPPEVYERIEQEIEGAQGGDK